jgi:hypothetical protein
MHLLARKLNWSRGSSVGIVTRIWAGQSKNTSSISERGTGFPFPQVIETETLAPPGLLFVGILDLFRRR